MQAKNFLNIFNIKMICGYDNFASEKVCECFQDNDHLRLRQFWGGKVFEFFQDKDDLRLRQFLQTKKSLNIFRIMIICGFDNFASEKIFEYFQHKDGLRPRQFRRRKIFQCFQDNDDLRLRHFCSRKKFWIFSAEWWFTSKTILQAKKSLNVSKIMMICV